MTLDSKSTASQSLSSHHSDIQLQELLVMADMISDLMLLFASQSQEWIKIEISQFANLKSAGNVYKQYAWIGCFHIHIYEHELPKIGSIITSNI